MKARNGTPRASCEMLLAAAALWHCFPRVCVLCAPWQPCEECQSMRPGHAVQCARRRAVGCACGAVTRPRTQSTATLLTARARGKNKRHRATASAAVHNAHGAVNGVEAAPC